jgi:hypothetical protein
VISGDPTIVSPGLGDIGSTPAARPAFGGLAGDEPGSTNPDGVPFVASLAPNGAGRTGGAGSLLPNRIPRRVVEIGVAVGSLAAVLLVVALVLSSGDDGGTAIASGGLNTTAPAAPGLDPDGGEDGAGGPTEFTSAFDLGDDEDGDGTSTTATPTTSGGQIDPSSTTQATGGGPSSTTASTSTPTSTSTSTSVSTSISTTSTTRPTTTTSTTQPTTTTTPALPIRIVSGPTVNVVNPRSFQFSYSTNDVCGTGSFRVVKVSTRETVGTFTGNDVCFGPLHGGFPGLPGNPEFAGFDIEPSTTYRVIVNVRGTASDGTRTAGSGSDSASFQVTTTAS